MTGFLYEVAVPETGIANSFLIAVQAKPVLRWLS